MSEPLSPEREAEICELMKRVGLRLDGYDEFDALHTLLAEVDRLRTRLAKSEDDLRFLHDNTIPELRRNWQSEEDGKKRWRDRAKAAEAERDALKARIDAVLDLCDREQRNAMRWEDPIPVPEWVAPVQRILLGDAEPATPGATSLAVEQGCDRCGHIRAAHNISGCVDCPGGWHADHKFSLTSTPEATS